MFMFFDHKNIERAESVLESRRASKKLVNWIADTQDIMANVVRVWVDGKLNVLADFGSRISWEYDVVRTLPVPQKPIIDIIRLLFRPPEETCWPGWILRSLERIPICQNARWRAACHGDHRSGRGGAEPLSSTGVAGSRRGTLRAHRSPLTTAPA